MDDGKEKSAADFSTVKNVDSSNIHSSSVPLSTVRNNDEECLKQQPVMSWKSSTNDILIDFQKYFSFEQF